MKQIIIFLFFILFIFIPNMVHCDMVFASVENVNWQLYYNNRNYEFKTEQKQNGEELFYKIKEMGFSDEIAINYIFKGLSENVNIVEREINKEPQDSTIIFDNVKGSFKLEKEKIGSVFNKKEFYNEIKSKINQNNYKINVDLFINTLEPSIKIQDLQKQFYLRSSFTTYFHNAQEGRAYNIKKALNSLNGTIISPMNELSFNETTGHIKENSGYKTAKIILDGKFVEGEGGGVCQASTTLYNSALLAGLTVTQAPQHSLKVNYVLAGFDAMVNSGGSDLKIKNTTSSNIYIETLCTEESATVNIYGIENEYTIKRRSELVVEKELEYEYITEKEALVKNIEVPQNYNIKDNSSDQIILKNAQPAQVYDSVLEYYKNDVLIKTEKLRRTYYGAKKGIILKHDA